MIRLAQRFTLILLTAVLLITTVACTPEFTLPNADPFAVTLTPLPTEDISTPTPVPGGAAEIGQTFYQAWAKGDIIGMYSLLSPQSQALVDNNTFVTQYETAMRTATVEAIRIQPLAASQEGARGSFQVQVIWDTAVLGPIERTHSVDLAFANGRWGVIWHEGLILPELTGGHKLVLDYKAPSRGNIYDVNGKALAYQGSSILLGVVPGRIEDEAGLLATISPLLNLTPEQIQEKYAAAQADWYVPLGDISSEAMQENYETLQPFLAAGLVADDRLTRVYSPIAPHAVGYIGAIPGVLLNDYLAAGYNPESRVGLTGLEAWGEDYLSGVRGGILNVLTTDGQYVTTVAEAEPRRARSVYATFDADFQRAVEAALAEAALSHPVGNRGAVVVLNPQDGAVLAMASYPTYDPTIFDITRPDNEDRLAAAFSDPTNPLLNRAAQSGYPPGSTFKVVTLAAAVRSGLYTAETRYNSLGSWDRLGENFIKTDWREGGHGYVSMSQALVVSCNTCFYDAGLNMEIEDSFFFPNIAREFGLGSSTGVIGISDAAGSIPDPEWKPLNTAEGGWVPGDAVNMAIGQGYVTATPLQMAQVIASVANGGTIYTPRLVDRIGEGGGAPEEKMPAQVNGLAPMDTNTMASVQAALNEVTSGRSGTATFAMEGLRVPTAGKTGTAQTPQPTPHAWFMGYAPSEPYTMTDGELIEQPEIAIVVIMENAGEGSEVAAPIFRRVVELYYNIQPLTPYPWK